MRNRIDDNTEDWYAANVTRTTGVWNQSRNNPALPKQCGLNIALIADTSGSLGATGIASLKSTMDAFADAFRGTSTTMAAFSFSSLSPGSGATNHPALLPVGTAAQAGVFKSQYAAWVQGGGTNWDQGFAAAANAAPHYDLAILLTDGNPTVMRNNSLPGSSAYNSVQDVDAGIFSANQLKAEGTRVVSLGIGPALTTASELNLRAVSGPVSNDDYYRATDFAAATQILVALAKKNCTGLIEVQKLIVPLNGTIADATPAPAGWVFDASANAAGVTVQAPTTQNTGSDGTGKVQFGLGFAGSVTSGAVQIVETQKPGFELQPVGTGAAARNAVCVNAATGAAVAVSNAGTASQPGFITQGSADALVTCKIYNRVLAPGLLEVAKISDPVSGTVLEPGQVVTYTLTFKNSGGQNVQVDRQDVLSGVLDDAGLVAGSLSAQPPLSAVLNGAGDRILVSGTLAPGETRTVTYKVKVKDPLPASADGILGNFIVKTGENPPSTCEPNQPCTVHPVKLNLSWNKVGPEGDLLKGSAWRLIPVNSDGSANIAAAIAVVDCVAASAAACATADKDPVAGKFALVGLTPGRYLLEETTAPAGYQLLTERISLVVNTHVNYGDIENSLVDVPVLPLTGGVGSLMFGGVAMACLIALLLLAVMQRVKSRQAGQRP